MKNAKIPWDPTVYGEKDADAAGRCRALLNDLGYEQRKAFVPTAGPACEFLRVLCDHGWAIPGVREVDLQVPIDLRRPVDEVRSTLERRIAWEAGMTLRAAGIDARDMTISIKNGNSQKPRAVVKYNGREGAFRGATAGGGVGLEIAMYIGLPGFRLIHLSGSVTGALGRGGMFCLPNGVLDALVREGLVEMLPAHGKVEADEVAFDRHNRVGLWCGIGLLWEIHLVELSWKTK